jgi:hypothetical protein
MRVRFAQDVNIFIEARSQQEKRIQALLLREEERRLFLIDTPGNYYKFWL